MHKAKALSPSFVLFVTDLAVQQLEHIFQSEKQCMFICHYDMFYILWLKGRVTLVAFTRIEKKKKRLSRLCGRVNKNLFQMNTS